jgi:hypothetical protein
VLHEARVGAVVRLVSGPPRRDGLLDLPDTFVLRPLDPGLLRLSGGDSSHLPDRRPAKVAGRESAVERRQAGERSADAEALLRLATTETERAVGILPQAGVAGANVNAQALGGEEPSAHLPLVTRALRAQGEDSLVDASPVRDAFGCDVLARV